MTFAENLVKLRKKAGLSQEDLAEKLNLTRQAISKYESGISAPNLNTLLQMGEIFEVSMDYLIKGVEQGKSSNIQMAETKRKRDITIIFAYIFLLLFFCCGVIMYVINCFFSIDYNFTVNKISLFMMFAPAFVFFVGVVQIIIKKRKR